VPRTDDPLAGVIVPTSTGANPSAALPSHLQRMYAEQLSQAGTPDHGFEARRDLESNDDYRAYIAGRLAGGTASPQARPPQHLDHEPKSQS
jgi:phospholipase C